MINCVRKVADDLYWVGGNDRRLELFENVHPIPDGVSYNAYLLVDEKTVLFDTVDWSICRQLIENIESVLKGKPLDYLVVNHVEPDHCGAIEELILRYPNLQIISTEKGFMLMRQFGYHVDGHINQVTEGDTFSFGKHKVTFVLAPMVHWPEVMVTFDITTGTLFSADAFGSFKALDGHLFNDEVDFDRDWISEARRYYTNIVGKYGPQVRTLLKKASTIDIKLICPLHGPVWRTDIGYLLDKYVKWSSYEPEEQGIMIVYASMYGNTEYAAYALASTFVEKGFNNVKMYDVSKTHVSYLISDTFKYSHIVLASVTYNLGIFPPMHNYLMDMKALNLQNRTFAIVENGSWACKSGNLMRKFIETEIKDATIVDEPLTLLSAMTEDTASTMDTFADTILSTMK